MKIRFKENLIQKVSLGDFWETNVPSRGNHQWQARGSTKAVRQKHDCHVSIHRTSGGHRAA